MDSTYTLPFVYFSINLNFFSLKLNPSLFLPQSHSPGEEREEASPASAPAVVRSRDVRRLLQLCRGLLELRSEGQSDLNQLGSASYQSNYYKPKVLKQSCR